MTVNEILILIPAVTAAVVSILNTLKAQGREHKLDQNTQLTAQTHDTTAQIKTLVNGQSEALKAALGAAQERIRTLEGELAALRGVSRPLDQVAQDGAR